MSVWFLGCSMWLPGYYEIVVYNIVCGCQAGVWLLGCSLWLLGCSLWLPGYYEVVCDAYGAL